MKRITFFLSLLLIAALVLTACEPAAETPLAETPDEPALFDTPTPGIDLTPPPVETMIATPEETPAETPVETPVETPAETPTPVAPDVTEAQPWRLSHLLEFTVLNQECEEVGNLNAIIADPATGQIHYAAVTATIFEETETGDDAGDEAEEGEGNLVLLPWHALVVAGEEPVESPGIGTPAPGANTPTPGVTPGADTPTPGAPGAADTPTPGVTPAADTPTPEAGTPTPGVTPAAETPTPGAPGVVTGQTFCPQEENAVILLVDEQVFSDAPRFVSLPEMAEADWDEEVVVFWNEHVDLLPVTGIVDVGAEPAVFSQVRGITLRGAGLENYGPIVEMVVDTQTGEITHVVWSPGGLLTANEQVIAIPWDVLEWDPVANHFSIDIEITDQIVQEAPGFEDLDQFPDPRTDPDWDQDVQDFWQEHRN